MATLAELSGLSGYQRAVKKAGGPTMTAKKPSVVPEVPELGASEPPKKAKTGKKGSKKAKTTKIPSVQEEVKEVQKKVTKPKAPKAKPEKLVLKKGQVAGPKGEGRFVFKPTSREEVANRAIQKIRAGGPAPRPRPSKLQTQARTSGNLARRALSATGKRLALPNIAPYVERAPLRSGALAKLGGTLSAGFGAVNRKMLTGVKVGGILGATSIGASVTRGVQAGLSPTQIAKNTAFEATITAAGSSVVGALAPRLLARAVPHLAAAKAGAELVQIAVEGTRAGKRVHEREAAVGARKRGFKVEQEGFIKSLGRALLGQAPKISIKETAYTRAVSEAARQKARRMGQ